MNIEKRIHRRVGEALRRFRMLEAGDRVLIGISGGKDSTTLAKVLRDKQRHLPISFELLACHAVTDILPENKEMENALDSLFAKMGIPLERHLVEVMTRRDKGRKMNCFFCAMHRRMAMIRVATRLGCNKIAYGHHLDDIIETLLMNMFYRGEISTMPALLELDRHPITIIRPLCLAKEHEVQCFAERFGLSLLDGPPCPLGADGRRQRIKSLVRDLARRDGKLRNNILASLGRVKSDYLLERRRS